MRKLFRNKWFLVTLFVALILAFSAGYTAGQKKRHEDNVTGLLNTSAQASEAAVDFEPFWKVWNIIEEKHLAAGNVTSVQDRVYGAINGLVKSLDDPYSMFFTPEELREFEDSINGEFSGVGIEISEIDGLITVVAPLKGTPAERAGVKAGDIILQVDDEPIVDVSINEAVSLIKGPVGEKVTLLIKREGVESPFEIEIYRDIIDIPTLETEIMDDVFVIRLFNFTGNAEGLFKNALRELEQSGKRDLIIDLRGNPGGFLEYVVDMASFFLPEGKVILQQSYADGQENDLIRSKGKILIPGYYDIVILIDGGSASASEIMAGALQDHGVATIVGTQSFGKGSVQELIEVTNDTSVKITISQWLTPNGNVISEQGITPDVEVDFTEEDIENDRDTQLEKAIEILKSR